MLAASLDGARAAPAIPAYGVGYGVKGCDRVPPHPGRATTASSSPSHRELSHLHWLVQHNGGVFLPPWGKTEQWTLSVQHTTADADRFVDNVNRFAETLSSLDRWVSADAVALND